MNKTLKTADEVRKLTKMFQALGDVVETLDRIGSVEQAEDEIKARILKLQAEAEVVESGLQAARAEAQQIVAEAQAKADEIAGEAEVAARNTLDQARAQEAACLATAKQATENAQQALEELRLAADEQVARKEKAEEDLAEIEKRADKARNYLQKLAS